MIYDPWDVGQSAQMLVKVAMDQALRTWKFLAVLGQHMAWKKIICDIPSHDYNPKQNLNNSSSNNNNNNNSILSAWWLLILRSAFFREMSFWDDQVSLWLT